ncbi:fasciclin domain-containing protein [Stakelama saccharophila]|uniref:Fasciclin domain-containing protein n=1 Tax=Stakelama saccharophila TaxID=3075605 RepID=A0ABZ0B6N7_9SPHN|nr:fasciclin domain-containing protein [Stakelama sp. W311]WNO53054.1 fasciclin domain-containing protein [Stakelama sp. W311]
MYRKSLTIFATFAGAAALAACASTSTNDDLYADSSTTSATAGARTPAPAPTPTPTPQAVTVGGAEMLPTATIVENASKASNLTTLVAALKAAGLAQTLSGPGPYTVFAPNNEAFNALPPGTVDTLMKPENKTALTKILNYHVVPGTIDADTLKQKVEAGGGTATLTTVQGDPLTATVGPNGNIKLTSEAGSTAYVGTADVAQANGIIHVVNGVLIPNLDGGSGSSDTSTGDGM